jgi:hypothetical protein
MVAGLQTMIICLEEPSGTKDSKLEDRDEQGDRFGLKIGPLGLAASKRWC